MKNTITVAELIGKLQALADEHGAATPVFHHDDDTSWHLPFGAEHCARFEPVRVDNDTTVRAIVLHTDGY